MNRGELTPDDPRHGMNGYTNLGCRCETCRAAWAAYYKGYRQRREQVLLVLPISDVEHGTTSTYSNWRCRCRPCKAAWAAYHRKLNATRRVASGRTP